MDMQTTWTRVIDDAREQLDSPHDLATFEQMVVAHAHPRRWDDDTLVVHMENRHYLSFTEDRFGPLLTDATQRLLGPSAGLRFIAEDAVVSAVVRQPAPHAEAPGRMRLDPQMTFDSFVVGACNRIAAAAARAVVDDPGGRWNPLYIYGASGLGKTHLLNAIGHAIERRDPTARVVYVTADDFVHEFVQAIRNNDTRAFRMHYREEATVLLMDDIQFLGGKEAAQEELFYVFNVLQQQRRQMVFTSDVEPQAIAKFEPRLRTRFQGGQIVDMQAPDRETATAILLERAQQAGHQLPRDLADAMAHAVTGNMRELLGLFNRLQFECDVLGEAPTLAFAMASMPDVFAPPAPKLDVHEIISAVARVFNLRTSDIVGKSRTRQLTEPRHVAMFLARRHTELSFPQLGEAFGGRDHSTIQHGVRKVQQRLDDGDPELAYSLQIIEKQLRVARSR